MKKWRCKNNLRIIDSKTEVCTDLKEISSVSGIELEQEENVRKFDINFILFYYKQFYIPVWLNACSGNN